MKKIFRKNQLVITALALMIAVAGYFSYMNNNIEDEQVAEEVSAEAGVIEDDYEISDEDVLMEDEIFTDEGTGDELALVDGTEVADAQMEEEVAEATETSATADGTDEVAATDENGAVVAEETGKTDTLAATEGAEVAANETGVENPGEAVLTSTTVANLDYAAEMKLNREQIRSKNKEALLEIINNTAIEESLKQDAVNKMIAMTDIAEREAAAEMLLEAKGFTDVVVSITDDNCDVVLNMGEVTDAKRAQVEDIVKRKTNVSADQIIITPIVVGEAETE